MMTVVSAELAKLKNNPCKGRDQKSIYHYYYKVTMAKLILSEICENNKIYLVKYFVLRSTFVHSTQVERAKF